MNHIDVPADQSSPVPPVALLGVVERYAYLRDGNTNLWKYNVLGLKQHVISIMFPLNLSQLGLAFAVYTPSLPHGMKLKLADPSGAIAATFAISLSEVSSGEGELRATVSPRQEDVIATLPLGWSFRVLTVGVSIAAPGLYSVLMDDGTDAVVGQLYFALVDPAPLTPDRAAAIRSDPNAIKAVRARLACNACGYVLQTYAGLERSPETEAEGFIWFENLPDQFCCSCGRYRGDLTVVRRNLHGFLGQTASPGGELAQVPLYERGAVANIHQNFRSLLTEEAPEETFQRFIEENPLVLHRFTPERIFPKAPILALYKTDFVIVNSKRELLLIELERPDTKILKKDGGVHSELQHAFDQARQWLHAADEHRVAVLECIGVARSEVGAVHAVVVAGRDLDHNADHLRALKGNDFGRISLLTYDDLLAGLGVLVRAIEDL
jgi:hypothetical protein